MQVVAAVQDGKALLDAVRAYQPDVVVLDLQLPFISGLGCLQRIREEKIPTHVLILTAFADGEAMLQALEYEADGYVLKTDAPLQTIAAIRQIAHGHIVFPRAVRQWLVEQRRQPQLPELSEREHEVLTQLAEGLTNAQIAERLSVSESTVKFHLQNIYDKLGVANRTEAAAAFRRLGGA
jgi:DNA-binding NarL/FixJ family response regulator